MKKTTILNTSISTSKILYAMKNSYTIKFILILFVSTFVLSSTNAQSKGVLIGSGTLDSKAIFQLESSDRGFLPPRMSTGERDANLPVPAIGMTIYNETSKMIETWDGTRWVGAGLFYFDSSTGTIKNNANRDINITGSDNNGTIAGLKISTSATSFMLIDNNEIDSNNSIPLILNGNSKLGVTLGSSGSSATNIIYGGDNNGSSAALRILDGSNTMHLDGNEIDSNGSLLLNSNSDNTVQIGSSGSSANNFIYGPDNNGTNAALHIKSGSQTMRLDGNEIDADDILYLNNNSNVPVYIGSSGSTAENIIWGGQSNADLSNYTFRIRTTGESGSMYLDDNEIDCTGSHLYLQYNNNDNWGVIIGNSNEYSRVQCSPVTNPSSNTSEQSLYPTATNSGYLGTPDRRWYRGYINDVVESSDVRMKENIRSIQSPLSKILRSQGKIYDWKAEKGSDNRGTMEKNQFGFIAQELITVFPELVEHDTKSDTYGINYIKMIPVITEAVKEQNTIIEDQKKEIADLKAMLLKMDARLKQLEE